MRSLIIHGRQPEIARAELESLYGSDVLLPVGNATLIDLDTSEIDFMRLGGMVKLCKVLTVLETTNWREVQAFLEKSVPEHAKNLPEGKLKLGLSVYGLNTKPSQLVATGLELKKLIKKSGRSVRVVPNKDNELNAAQVLHNQLTHMLGWELVFVKHGNKTILAQSIAVQDIDRYSARDYDRPFRDSKVGMLPPKLAQIIINLATSSAEAAQPACLPSGQPQKKDLKIIDPFCGTGVILQEATLMNFSAYGSDLDERMVDYSSKNLEWLKSQYPDWEINYEVDQADATNHQWQKALKSQAVIACETYLGRPFSSPPSREILEKNMSDCDTIHRKFLKNLAFQTKPGFRLCIAVPAWRVKNQFLHLRVLDSIDKMGYNRVKFKFSSNQDLVYYRPDQIVARELVVLERL